MEKVFNDGLFDDLGAVPPTRPTAPKKTQKPSPKKKEEKTSLGEGEGSVVRQITPKEEKKPVVAPKEDVLLKNVENACGGNRYLEAMILGEILNSPKFRR